ncbi:MAG TPA: hypothetical protein VFC53_03365 [Dehalococcoidia bacterium]|nr:hypothetical protein [Dehalococcoidia bacterium]
MTAPLPLLAASDWGIAVAIAVILLLFLAVGWVILQGTRAQLYWRRRVEEGDVEAIRMLVADEVARWKTMRMPRGAAPAAWHGVQGAELVDISPDRVRVNASAEGQYAGMGAERRETSSPLQEAMAVTARLAEMLLYDIPNVRLPYAQVDVYSTYRDEHGAAQRCILSTIASREVADNLDWDEMTPEEIVRGLGGRFSLDDRGNALPIDPDAVGPSGVPAVFYKDD